MEIKSIFTSRSIRDRIRKNPKRYERVKEQVISKLGFTSAFFEELESKFLD